MNQFTKDPNETLDFTFDWSSWLPSGDTISTSVFTVDAGITNASSSNTTTTAIIFLSGGTAGTRYKVANRITTAGGRIAERTIIINVEDR